MHGEALTDEFMSSTGGNAILLLTEAAGEIVAGDLGDFRDNSGDFFIVGDTTLQKQSRNSWLFSVLFATY